MQNQPLPENHAEPKIEELRQRNERMDLLIDIAFKERLYGLLINPNADPEELRAYLKMNEKREAQRQKDSSTNIKAREIELKERLTERRLQLEERKQALNERKFQHATEGVSTEAEKPASSKSTTKDLPQEKPKPSFPMVSSAPMPRNETVPPRQTTTTSK